MRILLLGIVCITELLVMVYFLTRHAKKFRLRFLFAAGCLVLFLFTGWILLFPHVKKPVATGPYSVATVQYYYTDNSRIETYNDKNEPRTLLTEFWYPQNMQADKACPLIVFSHGSFGVKESNATLFCELASRGYVVCSMDHTYQCMSTTDKNGNKIGIDKGFLKEVMQHDTSDRKQSYADFQRWMDLRTTDIAFILDMVLSEASSGKSGVYSLIDTEKIGLIGHSLGGSAVLGLGRTRNDLTCVIALESPFMCDIMSATQDAYQWNPEPYPIPVLNIYSNSTWDKLNIYPQYDENYRLLSSNSQTAYSVYLKGAGHMTLTDLALSCPLFCVVNGQNLFADGNECLQTMNDLCLRFFDCYLKDGEIFKSERIIEP